MGPPDKTAAGNVAFVPSPAPRELPLTSEVISLLDEASFRLGALQGIARRLPNPELLSGPSLRREAVLSSRIEGTGEFRTYQNFVGGTSEADATYVGPLVLAMHERLDDFERFLHERTLPPLVQAAVLHYQFETIPPFGDGNGRPGRLLVGISPTVRPATCAVEGAGDAPSGGQVCWTLRIDGGTIRAEIARHHRKSCSFEIYAVSDSPRVAAAWTAVCRSYSPRRSRIALYFVMNSAIGRSLS